MIGTIGTAPPAVHCVYDGKAESIDLPAGTQVAGITLRISGEVPKDFVYRVALRTPTGEHAMPGPAFHGGWFIGSQTRAILPEESAIAAIGVIADTSPLVIGMRVWAVGDQVPAPVKR